MAIFELDEKTQVYAMWAYGIPGDFDVLGMLFRQDGPWTGRWRFRHYKDDKVWESDDEKAVFQVLGDTTDESRDKIWEAIPQTVELAAAAIGDSLDALNAEFIVVDGSSEDAMKVLKNFKAFSTSSRVIEEGAEAS